MADRIFRAISLFTPSGGRKYLNAAERQRFRRTCNTCPSEVRLFCSVLYCSGCRISEALALTPAAIDLDDSVAMFQTLKRRRKGVMRQVPLPASLVVDLDRTFKLRDRQQDPIRSAERLWPWSRVTAWRRIKSVMIAANVTRSAAMPKGLRHSFGVIGFQRSVPAHLIQRWLGHASLSTTAIYGDVTGEDERAFASWTWPKGNFIQQAIRKLSGRAF
jgi:integrase/recombinase XerD